MKKFNVPSMELIAFNMADVIVTSIGGSCNTVCNQHGDCYVVECGEYCTQDNL